ncbi:MAG: hypothetical protein KGJ23_14820 [Euryarchaeota archaeon]|nr:hypothetical protein [Euryarchaeota archaeon]MDE2046218.1 hypothetical protein [Thermoplasmata archaeon]
MTWVLVLGPSNWVRGHKPSLPPDLGDLLPRSWVRRSLDLLWPIDIRAILVALLRREGQDAVLMEEEPRRGREPLLRDFALRSLDTPRTATLNGRISREASHRSAVGSL